jgi:signal peptidase II
MAAKYRKLLWISLSVVVLDQITKAVVLSTMRLYESIPVIPGLFNLTHIHNPGGAFGFMARQSETVRTLLFVVAALAALVLIFFFYRRVPASHPLLASGLALVFGGAIGNLIDRIRFGSVVDFLDFYLGEMHWPAFNVADSAVTVGMLIFVYHILLNKLPE